jgi:F-box-like
MGPLPDDEASPVSPSRERLPADEARHAHAAFGQQRLEDCAWPSASGLQQLPADVMLLVLGHLDPADLRALFCTSRALRRLAESPHLWEQLARRRWRHVNARLFPAAAAPRAGSTAASRPGAGPATQDDDLSNGLHGEERH